VDGCGCVRSEPRDLAAREARKRTFLVEVKFRDSALAIGETS